MEGSTKIVLLDAFSAESLILQNLENKASKYERKVHTLNDRFILKKRTFLLGIIDELMFKYYQEKAAKAENDFNKHSKNVKMLQKRIND